MAHETWQIDGKESVKLADGTEVSWMNIADEGTTAHLKAIVSRSIGIERMSQLSLQLAVWSVNLAFERWGLPNPETSG